MRGRTYRNLTVVAAASAVAISAQMAAAVVWKLDPATNAPRTATNWEGDVAPNTSTVATFGFSNVTTLANSGNFEPGGYEFTSASPGYAISGGTLYGRAVNGVAIDIQGGTGNHSISGYRPRATGTITNNSTGTLSFGSAGILAQHSSSGTITLTVDGTGNTVMSQLTRRNTSTNVNIVKAGTGTLSINGASTVVAEGTGSSGTVGFTTGSYTVNAGRLSAGASDILADVSPLILGGGTYATNGFDETLATPLTLNASSTIDLGAGDTVLTFADSSTTPWTGTLTIANWSGNLAGGGTDQLYFGNSSAGLTADQLALIAFDGYAPGAAILGTGEVVPATAAIPEPATLAALAGVGFLLRRRRR